MGECLAPYLATPPPYEVADLKRDIRELGLWCSSCMVAFEGDQPVAVLIGCKRPPDTLVRVVAVHPSHLRRGHGRHLLTSLSAKLSILGPPRLVAEVPAGNAAALGLFQSCGWREATRYSDLSLDRAHVTKAKPGAVLKVALETLPPVSGDRSWERTQATLIARRERMEALIVAPGDRIEASVVYSREVSGHVNVWRMEGDPASLTILLRDLAGREGGSVLAPRVSPEECPPATAKGLGFEVIGVTVAMESPATSR